MITEIEYALLAGASYYDTRGDVNRFPLPQDWGVYSRIPQNNSSGFEASSFIRTTGSSTEIVISYAGTDPSDVTGDIAADLALAAGKLSDQLRQAADYYLAVKAAAPTGATIRFTGHSLGGGLASLMAAMFDESAYTFDQAPFLQSARLFTSTDVLGRTSVTGVAKSLRDYLAGKGATADELKKLDAYIVANDPGNANPNPADTLAARGSRVTNVNTQGEFLSSWFGVPSSNRIGSQENIANSHNIGGLDLHSQSLLTAFLQSAQSASTNSATNIEESLNRVTFMLTDLLKMVFDSKLFYNDPNNKDNPLPNLLEHLVRDEAGRAGTGEVTRLTRDLWKLANTEGLAIGGSDLTKSLTAFALQMYYEQATAADKELFTRVTGGVKFDRSDVAAGLDAMKGYALYFKNFLATLPADVQEAIAQKLPELQEWYLGGERLGAVAGAKSAFMLGAGDTDVMIGGTQNDLIVGLAGTDVLEGGRGDDTLIGGEGFDVYRFNTGDGNDRIVDADRKGAILVGGGDAGGGVLAARQRGSLAQSEQRLHAQPRLEVDADARRWQRAG